MIGTVGEEKTMQFTAYGDAINRASYVESLTKKYGTNLLITDNVYCLIKNHENTRVVDSIQLKDKKKLLLFM